MKAATVSAWRKLGICRFQSTPPVKAATVEFFRAERVKNISIHAAREGGDTVNVSARKVFAKISIHAAREGGDHNRRQPLAPVGISIHAAREGGDVTAQLPPTKFEISIHAAREGGDCGNE